MATRLRQLLQSLCMDTEWNYAVFWRVRHCTPMVLTCEDAYYNNHFIHGPSENEISCDLRETWHDGHFAHDPLGMAVAKMSNHVYFHGEGIVGKVAVMGNHRWIFAADHLMNSSQSPELYDGWKMQFSVGIKTIVFAAVPHGVVQLGSLSKVNEDFKFLSHIRGLFSSLQDSSPCHIQNPIQCSTQDAMQLLITPTTIHPDALRQCIFDPDKNVPLEVNDKSKLSSSFSGNQQFTDLKTNAKFRTKNYRIQNAGVCSPSQSCLTITENCNIPIIDDEDQLSEEKPWKVVASDPQENQKVKINTKSQLQSNCMEVVEHFKPSFIFSAHNDLHEAIEPASNVCDIIESNIPTTESLSDHFLEAEVAKYSTAESTLTTEKNLGLCTNTSHAVASSCNSIDRSLQVENPRNCINSSDSCNVGSNKKRARPNKGSCSRPTDRQVIENRIKELRKLVPNGSKGSIDSLLERTIKHMVYLQNATTNAGKLSNCTKSRGCSNEMGVLGSDREGSSWAVEVGGHMKILVESLNVNGKMQIEMLCEDCHQFLEIAEAIKSLGLIIVKGVTDNCGDKIWMRFVVEGQGNRILHRMEVLWSLLHLLQSETTA